jgi:hypothetical protein
MAAFKVNLKIDQGATFSKLVTWKTGPALLAVPVDITGCTARMHARGKIADAATLLDLTTANGGIVLGGAAGTVEIKLTDEQTAAITWAAAVYDLEIEFADGTVRRLLQGSISVSPEVTRA